MDDLFAPKLQDTRIVLNPNQAKRWREAGLPESGMVEVPFLLPIPTPANPSDGGGGMTAPALIDEAEARRTVRCWQANPHELDCAQSAQIYSHRPSRKGPG